MDKHISMEKHISLRERINAAIDMFDDERYTDCATEMKDMLSDHSLPGYYRNPCYYLRRLVRKLRTYHLLRHNLTVLHFKVRGRT